MTHPLFRSEMFVETAFEKRFQAMLRSAWHKRSWHVIVADPGSGKTMGIRDLLKTAGGRSVLAVVTPKNNDDEQALGDQFFAALGVPIRGHWSTRKPKLMGHLHQSGTECLVVDDAHDLSMPHLMFLKEVTDQGRLQYDHPLGLCLVAAGRGNMIPLKEILDQSEPTWLQWRRRLDPLQPFCRVAGHTSEELREILATLETVFRPLLPQLNLRRWTSSIYDWLTQSVLDPTNSGRVTMDNLMKLVIASLEWSYEAKASDVQVECLEQAAELLVLRHDTFRIIDGEGPSTEAPPSESTERGNESKTEPETETERETVSANHEPHTTETVIKAGEQVQTAKTPKCTFPGVVSIELKRFQESSTHLVECPDCGRTRTLTPLKGMLRFPSHKKRKTMTPNSGHRWAMRETIWEVVGGESK
jgi:AAA domain